MAELAYEHLRDLRDAIVGEMRTGFAGVHTRQDIANGRLLEVEASINQHEVKLKNLDREVFHRPRPAEAVQAAVSGMSRLRIFLYVVAAIGGVTGLSEASHLLGQALRALLVGLLGMQ